MKLILNEENEIMIAADEAEYAHVIGQGEDAHWESCPEEIAREDYENRNFEDENNIKDGGIILPSKQMIIPFVSGAREIVDADVPEDLNVLEYKYIDGEFILNTRVRESNIKQELEQLDIIINRATEDLYKATGVIAYETVQNAINKKDELRAELATL